MGLQQIVGKHCISLNYNKLEKMWLKKSKQKLGKKSVACQNWWSWHLLLSYYFTDKHSKKQKIPKWQISISKVDIIITKQFYFTTRNFIIYCSWVYLNVLFSHITTTINNRIYIFLIQKQFQEKESRNIFCKYLKICLPICFHQILQFLIFG